MRKDERSWVSKNFPHGTPQTMRELHPRPAPPYFRFSQFGPDMEGKLVGDLQASLYQIAKTDEWPRLYLGENIYAVDENGKMFLAGMWWDDSD